MAYRLADMNNPMRSPRYVVLRMLLKTERESRGLTQAELAALLGKPQSYVSKYECGERRLDMVEYIDILRAIQADPVAVTAKLIDKLLL